MNLNITIFVRMPGKMWAALEFNFVLNVMKIRRQSSRKKNMDIFRKTKLMIYYFKHRAGQRCFELLALIGSPQLSFQRVFPAEQTSWPNWQTLLACREADA